MLDLVSLGRVTSDFEAVLVFVEKSWLKIIVISVAATVLR